MGAELVASSSRPHAQIRIDQIEKRNEQDKPFRTPNKRKKEKREKQRRTLRSVRFHSSGFTSICSSTFVLGRRRRSTSSIGERRFSLTIEHCSPTVRRVSFDFPRIFSFKIRSVSLPSRLETRDRRDRRSNESKSNGERRDSSGVLSPIGSFLVNGDERRCHRHQRLDGGRMERDETNNDDRPEKIFIHQIPFLFHFLFDVAQ